MIQTILTDFIQGELLNHHQTIDEDQDLLVSGLIDSIGVMRLVGFIESSQGTKIPPQDVTLENFSNVKAIISYLSARSEP